METQKDLKTAFKKLLSSGIKREHGQSNEDFIEVLKARALPILSDLEGAQLSDFYGNTKDEIKSSLTNDLLNRLDSEAGIAISFSDDLPDYKEIKEALLEVISELKKDS